MSLQVSAPRRRCSRRDPRVLREAVERRLASLVAAPAGAGPLDEAVRYALLAPGKRIRPLLTMLAAGELGADELDALDAGCALEMVHAASLILDDLPSMDDAAWRRGRPATHVRFGENGAILAAVALLSRASAAAAGSARLGSATRCALVGILAGAVGTAGLAGGQYEELRAGSDAALDRVVGANHMKTGMLFVAAVEMAVAIAGADESRLERMRLFAAHLGQAFQLLDDLADGGGADPLDGGEDGGKVTAVSLLGPEGVRQRLDGHLRHALDELDPEGRLANFVRGIFASRPEPRGLGSVAPGRGVASGVVP